EVSEDQGDAVVAGLPYEVRIGEAEAAHDRLLLRGLDGDDRLVATPGVGSVLAVALEGGPGNDRIAAPAPQHGDGGGDTADFSAVDGPVTVDLDATGPQAVNAAGYAVRFGDVPENFLGSAAEDQVRATPLAGGRAIDGGAGGAVLNFDTLGRVARV